MLHDVPKNGPNPGATDTPPTHGLRIGVDSGGTFTDVCLLNEATGEIYVWKVSSTPDDPARAIIAGVREALAAFSGTDKPHTVSYFCHGTTVATNVLLEKKGAKTGLITTSGFRDVLELRRQHRLDLYALQGDPPEALVTRDRRLEVAERIDATGAVLQPLDEEGVRRAVRHLREEGVEAVAICFLFSFRSPGHEQRARQIVEEEAPGMYVSVSYEVAPVIGEYERLSTVVANAYVGPAVDRYLAKLSPQLSDMGIHVSIHLTQSSGGIISADIARKFPVRTMLSGPAAGVAGAKAIAERCGSDRVLTLDMGGTSADVSMIYDGEARFGDMQSVDGYPLRIPMLDIHAVGAGGGSIAYIDEGGLMRVGPRSAGAFPGPVCYGAGSEEATVTDAHVVLGVLNQTHLLDGRMPIDAGAARAVIDRMSKQLGLELMETAQGIVSIVLQNMLRAIRAISVECGYDPRDFDLMAFGGAGPLHAARLGQMLEVRRVIIPPTPGIMCATGLLMTDLKSSFWRSQLVAMEPSSIPDIESVFIALERDAEDWLEAEGVAVADRSMSRAVDVRYKGQGHDLTVPYTAGGDAAAVAQQLRSNLDEAHARLYGYAAGSTEAAQIVTLRVEAIGNIPKAVLGRYEPTPGHPDAALKGSRTVFLPEAGGFAQVNVYDRRFMRPGHVINGPAIIEQMDSTTLVLPDQTGTVDPALNLILERQN